MNKFVFLYEIPILDSIIFILKTKIPNTFNNTIKEKKYKYIALEENIFLKNNLSYDITYNKNKIAFPILPIANIEFPLFERPTNSVEFMTA